MNAAIAGTLCLTGLLLAETAPGETVSLVASRDATLYQGAEVSNGGGQHLFAGTSWDGLKRHAILEFEVVGNVPSNAIVESATLRLHLSSDPILNAPPLQFILDQVCDPWGEGTNDAPGEEFEGLPAQPGDATFTQPSFGGTETWRGGMCLANYTNIPMLVADQPGMYHFTGQYPLRYVIDELNQFPFQLAAGFTVSEDGTGYPPGTLRRFDSREHPNPEFRPTLIIEYSLPCAADLDADSDADVFDLLDYLELWFAGDASAEWTGDDPAAVDVLDLLAFLDAWFGGC